MQVDPPQANLLWGSQASLLWGFVLYELLEKLTLNCVPE